MLTEPNHNQAINNIITHSIMINNIFLKNVQIKYFCWFITFKDSLSVVLVTPTTRPVSCCMVHPNSARSFRTISSAAVLCKHQVFKLKNRR